MATTQAKLWNLALGTSYAGFKVYHYSAGTTSDKDVYRDAGKTTTDTQPVLADANGFVSFYGDGNYRLKIVTSADILLWDLDNVDISGNITGTDTRIPFFNSSGSLTEDARVTYDSTNNRAAIGTSTNKTEKLVIPYGYLGIVRDGASTGEAARGVVGLDSSGRVVVDREGMGVVMPKLTLPGLLYVDANGELQVLTLTNGQLPIGSSGTFPIAALPIASTGMTITPGAGSLSFGHSGITLYDRATSNITVTNTTTKTTLYSFTIRAGDLGTNKCLKILLAGLYENSSGANRTLTITITIGTTAVYEDTTANITSDALARPFLLSLDLFNRFNVNDTWIAGRVEMGNVAAATAGRGDLATDSFLNTAISWGVSEDSTQPLLFDVPVTHSAAASTINITRNYAYALLI